MEEEETNAGILRINKYYNDKKKLSSIAYILNEMQIAVNDFSGYHYKLIQKFI